MAKKLGPQTGMGGLGIVPGYVDQAKAIAKPVNPYGSGAFIYNPGSSGGTRSAVGSGITGSGGGGGGGGGGLTGAIGSGSAPYTGETTIRTMTPMQVYQSDILGDQGSVAAEGVFNTTDRNLRLARQDAITRALFGSGWTPQMSGQLADYSGDVTQSALDAAAANPMSQKAQLDLQLSQAKANNPYDLAASGAGRSGAMAIQLGNLGRQYDTASYQGMQDLLNAIYGAVGNYASGYGNAQNALEAARREVADRLARQAGYSESIVTTPTGGGGGGGDGGGGDGGGGEDYWAPSPNPATELSPSYPAPVVNQAVQKAIKAVGVKKGGYAPKNLYQTIKQTYLGG